MDSPRSGFRRAAATSWALAGIGILGVAGASTLAYADTVKPVPAETPAEVVEPSASIPTPDPALILPMPPAAVTPSVDPPAIAPPPVATAPVPETNHSQAPAQTYVPAPRYTPSAAAPQAPVTPPAPVTHVTPPTSQGGFPIRTSHVPAGGSSPNFNAPHVTRSRGS